jgi:hypothetical protein
MKYAAYVPYAMRLQDLEDFVIRRVEPGALLLL